jgi:hypothetical protein
MKNATIQPTDILTKLVSVGKFRMYEKEIFEIFDSQFIMEPLKGSQYCDLVYNEDGQIFGIWYTGREVYLIELEETDLPVLFWAAKNQYDWSKFELSINNL